MSSGPFGCQFCHNSDLAAPLINKVTSWVTRGEGQSPEGGHFMSVLWHTYSLIPCINDLLPGSGCVCVNPSSSIHIIWCHYNAIQYNVLLLTVLHRLRQNLIPGWTHKRHPVPQPHRWAMGCLLWGFERKLSTAQYIGSEFSLHSASRSSSVWQYKAICKHSEDYMKRYIFSLKLL